MRRECVYDLLDALLEAVSDLHEEAWSRGNLDSASWLACAEDAVVRFVDDFDDHVDAEAERRWDRQMESDLEDGVSGAMELAMQAEAGRRLK